MQPTVIGKFQTGNFISFWYAYDFIRMTYFGALFSPNIFREFDDDRSSKLDEFEPLWNFKFFDFSKIPFLLGVIRLRLWAQIKHIFAYLILVINMTHIPTEGIWTIGEFRIKNLMTHKNDSFRLKKIVRIFKYHFSHYLYNKVNHFFVKIDLNKKLYKLVNFKQLRNSNYVSALYKNILFSNDFKIILKRAFRYSYGI